MTFVIASACIDVLDKSCIEVCPVDCIFAEDEDRMCYIEPNDCMTAVCASLLVLLVQSLTSPRCLVRPRNLPKLMPFGLKTKRRSGENREVFRRGSISHVSRNV